MRCLKFEITDNNIFFSLQFWSIFFLSTTIFWGLTTFPLQQLWLVKEKVVVHHLTWPIFYFCSPFVIAAVSKIKFFKIRSYLVCHFFMNAKNKIFLNNNIHKLNNNKVFKLTHKIFKLFKLGNKRYAYY